VPARVTGDWEMPAGFAAVTRELSMTQRFDDAQLADIRRAYYACLSEVDYQLGRRELSGPHEDRGTAE
jgi:arylsulfatase